jgi:hypothetical protein
VRRPDDGSSGSHEWRQANHGERRRVAAGELGGEPDQHRTEGGGRDGHREGGATNGADAVDGDPLTALAARACDHSLAGSE